MGSLRWPAVVGDGEGREDSERRWGFRLEMAQGGIEEDGVLVAVEVADLWGRHGVVHRGGYLGSGKACGQGGDSEVGGRRLGSESGWLRDDGRSVDRGPRADGWLDAGEEERGTKVDFGTETGARAGAVEVLAGWSSVAGGEEDG